MKNLIYLLIASFVFTGCVNFTGTDVSVWAGYKWVAFWLPLLGGIPFIVMAIMASKSDSTKQLGNNTGRDESAGDVPFYKLAKFWIGVALELAAIGIYLGVTFTER